ncbi:MAG: glutamine--fructose-6-phosphate transaminase (isomerizing) [Candidatus Gracilibacteria bacterium]|nr:glutamine--fructose-6-phosphate transaminase (isomerizing) [Candidatus Gracilibacteria bacterium]
MCGIFGFTGKQDAAPLLLKGLSRLEYRGYDSAGICVVNGNNNFYIGKAVGKVMELRNRTEGVDLAGYTTGIGHTRWATHGGVTTNNCHPHTSSDGRFAVVHNGIIENYSELRTMLQNEGYIFYGETDTEVAAKLFEHLFDEDDFETLKKLTTVIEGAYALVFIDRENPNRLFGAKLGSPLVIGIKGDSCYVSSDYRSLIGTVEEYITLEDGDIFCIENGDYRIVNCEVELVRDKESITEKEQAMELGDFPHFMLKEIHEQGEVLRNVFAGRVDFQEKTIRNNTLDEIVAQGFERIHIIASGTSYHAGYLGKQYLEHLADLPTEVTVSTEFKYGKQFIDRKTLYIFVSQSGETADSLESMKIVNERGGYTFGIVNVPGSSISRLAKSGLFTHAGVEVGVASTKAFTAQIATFLILALAFGQKKDLEYTRFLSILEDMEKIPDRIETLLKTSDRIREVAEKYARYPNFFYLGRSYELPIAMEGSLKLKELTYRHSEAYSSGELKHGSLALIDADFPSIIINGSSPLHGKNCSSVQEVKSRGGKMIGIIASNDQKKDIYDDYLTFEASLPETEVFSEVVILQLFAYHMANALGRDIDKPRNLAKSVTVE